jgi:hypothetical protein
MRPWQNCNRSDIAERRCYNYFDSTSFNFI